MITATRHHDFSCGHRVHGHESKCANLHGHNYRIHFTLAPRNLKLDEVGRVLDFSVIKSHLCDWLEREWDHRFIAWEEDPVMKRLVTSRRPKNGDEAGYDWTIIDSIVFVPFNPTAENMAGHLLRVVGPAQLERTSTELIRVTVDETRKCSATAELTSACRTTPK